MQRIVSNYNVDALVVHRQYELSTDHAKDLKDILNKHVSAVTSVNKEDLGLFGIAKYEYYISQVQSILTFASELRESRLPYGTILLQPILRAMLFGPLADLVDPNKYPAEAQSDASIAESGRASMSIQKTVRAFLRKYSEEKLASSPELIREMIAKAQEKEQDGIINELDAMSEDDKRLELIKKKLGIGRWAIGGTKLIWAYNADQYDKEREARLQNYDAEGETRDGIEQLGRPVDAQGFPDYGEEYTERQGGYDVTLYDQDDAE